ncbi:lichenicidin A2 family type 2 lantibiotic [Kocuria marina]|uniref:lichenicidin A2 family type 2 lantibiotic n=1 Tax=Kocuria marina TaxID=223184 RepID=UPI0038502A8E
MSATQIVGTSFDELTQTEMDFVTGAAATAQPAATPTIATVSSGVCAAATTSSAPCLGGAAASAVGGLASYVKKCL